MISKRVEEDGEPLFLLLLAVSSYCWMDRFQDYSTTSIRYTEFFNMHEKYPVVNFVVYGWLYGLLVDSEKCIVIDGGIHCRWYTQSPRFIVGTMQYR